MSWISMYAPFLCDLELIMSQFVMYRSSVKLRMDTSVQQISCM